MLLSILCLSVSICGATDTGTVDTPDPTVLAEQDPDVIAVRAAVQKTVVLLDSSDQKLDALEHFLADQQAARDGRVPNGWMQPGLDRYLGPDAPDSYLPIPEQHPTP